VVEGLGHLGVDHPGRLALAPRRRQRREVGDWERQQQLRGDDRRRPAVAHHESGAQDLMPAGDLGEAARQHRDVERARMRTAPGT
jgi:hypothetical protein